MIVCVTLNPCLDKTLTVPPWAPGASVRGLALRSVVGGKGNNVARALKRLGQSGVRPATFLGGPTGIRCAGLLREDDGLEPIIVPTAAETRVILTVATRDTPDQTAFFDPDPEIRPEEADALARQVETLLAAGSVRAMTLSGSSPSDATHSLYSDLIALAKARKVPVFLDTYGPALEGIWGFWPDVIQLNAREAAAHLGVSDPPERALFDLLARWSRRGVALGVITRGADPALAVHRGRAYRLHPPAIEPVNPIGSGDCLLAGLVDGWLAARPVDDLLRRAMACGVANALVWDAGGVDPEAVDRIAPEVVVEPLEG